VEKLAVEGYKLEQYKRNHVKRLAVEGYKLEQ
jgi:hypothetical protein